LGEFEQELVKKNLAASTLIIVSAKHGQSPIDKNERVAISDSPYAKAPGFGTHGFEICDDTALVWLSPELQQATDKATGKSYYAEAKDYILAHRTELHIAQLLDRTSLTPLYGDPFKSSRVPDFIALTDHGVICTGGSKLSEHGGFSDDDRNVALMLSAPQLKPEYVEALTYTTQIAPTILHALGLNPNKLEGVQKEGTPILRH
jgi:arylsulfatase A-like enzyme